MSSAAHAPAGPSLAGRFAAAVALTVGFYVLALALAGALLAAAILPWILSGPHNLWITLTGLVLGVTILVAIVPRRHRFEAPGLRVTETEQPRLFELIAEEAQTGGEPMPDDVYVTLEANAAVTQVSRRRRVLIVGLPLLRILTERELRGVIAHEFGHYSGGDTRLGPWIRRTWTTIVRTVDHLTEDEGEDEWWAQKVVRQPFIWYGRAFMRITAAIKRRQEFAADRCAVRSVGRAVHVAALERVHAYAPGFDHYWESEVVPVLSSGRRPGISDGFRRYIEHEDVEKFAGDYLSELREAETDPYDSHPSLPERIAAVEGMPDGDSDDSPCAIEVLADPAALERALLRALFGPEVDDLEPVAWEAVGREVYGELARARTERFGAVLQGVTLGTLPEAVEAIPEKADKLTDPDLEERHELVACVLADGALLGLERSGWSIEAEPAQPIMARRGEDVIAPHNAINALRTGELGAASWRERVEELGVADVALDVAAPARALGAR